MNVSHLMCVFCDVELWYTVGSKSLSEVSQIGSGVYLFCVFVSEEAGTTIND